MQGRIILAEGEHVLLEEKVEVKIFSVNTNEFVSINQKFNRVVKV